MSVETESDAAVMARVQAGELEQFATLIRRYQPALLRVARGRLGDLTWAEDAVQETFLAVYKARHTYDPQKNFRTWLWTILINQCRTHGRKRSRWLRIFSGWPSAAADDAQPVTSPGDEQLAEPIDHLLARERSALLEKLLAELPSNQADALRLRFFGGLRFPEIAAATGCSLLTAKNRVRLGLLRLSQLISARDTFVAEQEGSRTVRPLGRNRV